MQNERISRNAGLLETSRDAEKREEREVQEAASRVLLRGDGIDRPLLNEPNEFIIDASDNSVGEYLHS